MQLFDENIYSTPEGNGETPSIKEYLTYWGIEYNMGMERVIYHLEKRKHIAGNWR